MKGAFAAFGIIVAVLVGVAGLAVYGNGLDLAISSFFSPRREAVRYNTFKQSQSYNEGVVADLMDIRTQYIQAKDDAAKKSLAALFIYKVQHYPNPLPDDLQAFYDSIKG